MHLVKLNYIGKNGVKQIKFTHKSCRKGVPSTLLLNTLTLTLTTELKCSKNDSLWICTVICYITK